ncbi:MAG TPA: hypothetical protein VN815_13135 [Steroidobacteraceae bacterium]|jgi:hypothetical protein|nr:hypothetical protein [Steroidobacteraceae bacterium]
MNTSKLSCVLVCAAVSALAVSAVSAAPAAPAAAYKAPLNAYGQPDLEGTWTNASLTVLERPKEYGTRRALSEEETKKIEGDESKVVADGNKPTDPKVKTTDLPHECGRGFSGAGCGYNSAWIDPGSTVMRVNGEPRTSFITDPADGRLPPYKAGVTVPNMYMRAHYGENPENQTLAERCLTSFGYSAGPVMLPLLYNNNYEIAQSKDTVAIVVEMVHDVRMIHIGGKHRTDGARPWMGDSIGWYEGPTLVVETTNFPEATALRGAWKELKVTERFTRVGPHRILYQFKAEDPTVWDRPWSGEYEFSSSKGRIFEYACHEGNYALEGILSGARADEAAAAEKAKAAAANKTASAQPAPASAVKKQ